LEPYVYNVGAEHDGAFDRAYGDRVGCDEYVGDGIDVVRTEPGTGKAAVKVDPGAVVLYNSAGIVSGDDELDTAHMLSAACMYRHVRVPYQLGVRDVRGHGAKGIGLF